MTTPEVRKPRMKFHLTVDDLDDPGNTETERNLAQNTLTIMATIATFLSENPFAWVLFQAWGQANPRLGRFDPQPPHGEPGHVCGLPDSVIHALQPHMLADFALYCIEAVEEADHDAAQATA